MKSFTALAVAAFAATALFLSPASATKKPVHHRPPHRPAVCSLAMSPGKSGRLVADATRTFYDFRNSIPESVMRQAKAVIIVPALVKVGFIIGGQGGDAVLLQRKGRVWTYPAFYSMGSPSFGLQAGISSGHVILVICRTAPCRPSARNASSSAARPVSPS